jgi:adenylate cyclase class IV
MVEVEKKFLLSNKEQTQLLDGAEFLYEKTIIDTYFDDENYSLTTADMWLRKRDGKFELKAPLSTGSGSYESANRYHEITSEVGIATELHMIHDDSLSAELGRRGINSFVTCYTLRKSYSKDGFTIDIDSASYDDTEFTHSVAEIELLVEEEMQADAAEARILNFANEHGLSTGGVILGKIAAYLLNENPEHYNALVAANVLK